MRFVFAIVAFVLAAVMIVLGIAQRTVFLEPAFTSLSATVPDDARYVVVDSKALTAHDGSQTVTVSGSGPIFVAYGRSADVQAWVGDARFAAVTLKKGADTLSARVEKAADAGATSAPEATPAVGLPTNPAGSDLWLEEFTGKGSLTTTINVPEDISMIVASDGTAPAPTKISVSWPTNNATPWAGPLIVGGALLALIGLVLYLWALLHLRRSRGPRRNLPRGPRMPKLPRAPRPKMIKASEITGQRRSIARSLGAVVPVVLVSGLVLTGCSPDFWPAPAPSSSSVSATPTPDATLTPDAAADVPPPAVTVPQLEQIVRHISQVATEADANLDVDAIATRFTGPALEQRLANYAIRAKIADFAAAISIPDSEFELTLPQQSAGWPRTVMTVVKVKTDPSVAPTALVLTQDSARANYLVDYAVQLEPGAPVPEVAPATIGAPIIKPDIKLLVLPPDQIAAAYSDILSNGEASSFYSLFEADGDSFRAQIAQDQQAKKSGLPTTASIEFGAAPGPGPAIALGTIDSGGIVAINVNETETVKPVDAGATVSPSGASAALSGVTATAKGIQSTYGDQLLFHVPAAGSNEKIVLLGFAQGLISSAELP
ncbi:hypothetical protein GCM10022381_10750 [Leifsonia kafniensis]|uniref:DUF8094 domain-containing protein n=1 Tax=Leifsonia kafniensis TaxID=475957 RepID=A0ABP7K8C8_9MICO